MNGSGATFADAAAEWIRFIAEDRERKPSTVRDYRNALEARLLPAFGSTPIEDIDVARIEAWRATLDGLSSRSKNKLLIMLHGIFRRAQTVYRYAEGGARRRQRRLGPSARLSAFSRQRRRKGRLGCWPRSHAGNSIEPDARSLPLNLRA